MFFRSHFRSTLGKGTKSTQEAQQDGEGANLVTDSGCPPPPGERQREGIKSLGLHNELGLSDSRSVMGKSVSESDLVTISHASHTFGGRRSVTPRGGPPPPTLFCPAHGGRISFCGRTLGVCTLKKVGLLSLFSLHRLWGGDRHRDLHPRLHRRHRHGPKREDARYPSCGWSSTTGPIPRGRINSQAGGSQIL